jgi:adenine deaminase
VASRRVLSVARGDAPGDLLLDGGRVLNVFTGELLEQAVTIADGVVAAVGEPRAAARRVDLRGRFLLPGFVDAHVHLESSMTTPREFARAVVPRGTTTVVCDPHEVANVAGADGVRWLLDASEGLPLDVLVMAPSCVPASHLSTSGAVLEAADLVALAAHPRVLGLGEVMNLPGAVLGDDGLHAKLGAFAGRPVDGHAPGLTGPWLDAYLACGIGSDHECLSAEEATAKLRRGMRVFLRQATGARNLLDLLPAVTPATVSRCALCTDDRHPHDLLDDGHLDHLLRMAVAAGTDPVTAVRLATIGAADAFGLNDRGAIAPGRRADLVVTPDLESFRTDMVLVLGEVVSRDGTPTHGWPEPAVDDAPVRRGLRIDAGAVDLTVRASSGRVRVVGLVPGQVVTEALAEELRTRSGEVLPDPARDVLKLAVLERHHGTGRVGLGFVHGLGLPRGAIAGTVAHDHHNLVVAGADDGSMRSAARSVTELDGGLAVTDGESVLATLALPLAGLMSDRPMEEVRAALDGLLAAVRTLGGTHPDPFMALSFVALEVIPALKLTDRGLVDVNRFELVPLEAG